MLLNFQLSQYNLFYSFNIFVIQLALEYPFLEGIEFRIMKRSIEILI